MARILYVEDNPLNMRLVRKILRSMEFEMLEAADGLSALYMAISGQPDLILMDINLPDMDGVQAMTRIKREVVTSDIPVVALTANAMHGDRQRFLAAGFDGYLAKPISKLELRNVIQFFLNNQDDVAV